MCFGGFHPAKNVEVPPTPVGGAPQGEYSKMPILIAETLSAESTLTNTTYGANEKSRVLSWVIVATGKFTYHLF
jgi:hypothetical protein